MIDKQYIDFDLLLERVGPRYRARVLNSPAGPAMNEFVLPFSDDKLENFILRISQGRRRVRNLKTDEVDTSREFGSALFKAVFDNDVDICLRNSITALDTNQSLRIRLRLSAAPELVDIPWEYLYDPSTNRFLALSVDTPLVRYLDLPGRIVPLTVKPPLNVLVMISSPTDVVQLDVEQEWRKLKSAVADLEQRQQLHLERLENATLDALQQRLRRGDYHIFHFIGHGGFDPSSNDGLLMFEDEQGRGKAVSGQILGTLFHDEKTLRLALLNACEGGRTAKSDPFAGVGQSLLQQGVPAVIAMQFEVTDDTAITLAHAFYEALADGYPVDAALTEARKTIFARNALEWGTPVLYMRSPDGRIFDVASIEPTTKLQNQLSALLAIGQAALGAQEWPKAAEAFQQILTLDPSNSTATSGLASAQQGLTADKAVAPPQPKQVALSRQQFGLGLGIVGALLVFIIGWLVLHNLGGTNAGVNATDTATPDAVAIAAQIATATAMQAVTETAKDEARKVELRVTLQAEQTQTVAPIITADAATREAINAQLNAVAATATQAFIDGKINESNSARATTEALQRSATAIAATATAAERLRQLPSTPPTVTPTPTKAAVSGSTQTTYIDCPANAQLRKTAGSVHNRLYIGGTAIVLAGATPESRLYRSETYENKIGDLPVGREVLVLDGPRCVKGNSGNYYQRWLVQDRQSGRQGWTSEGGRDFDGAIRYWLEPQKLYQACPGYGSRINVGDRVYMAWQIKLKLRNSPSSAETAVVAKRLEPGKIVTVVAGPECADQWTFWQLEVDGSRYWAGEGDPANPANGYWLVPVVGDQAAPAAASNQAAATDAADFSGPWHTNFAEMTLQQAGNTVSGGYTQYSLSSVRKFTGTVVGNTLTGTNERGTVIRLTLSRDGQSFTGEWVGGDGRSYPWCGVRSGALLPGCGFSGDWLTNQREGGWVRLEQVGSEIRGRYYNGATEGDLTGQFELFGNDQEYSLTGNYHGDNGDRGIIRFFLTELGNEQFQGCWQDQTSNVRQEWCGWREGQPAPPCAMPTVCP